MWFLALETHAVTWLAGAGEDLLALQGLHQVQQAVLEWKNWLLLFSVIFITVKQKSLENHQMAELILF